MASARPMRKKARKIGSVCILIVGPFYMFLVAVLFLGLDGRGPIGPHRRRAGSEQESKQDRGSNGGRRTQSIHKCYPIRLYRQCAAFHGLGKPSLAAFAIPRRQSELLVPPDSGIEPSRGIAETLAAVLAPSAAARFDVVRLQRPLAPFGRPAEFAQRARQALGFDKFFVGTPRGIALAEPDEVE